MSDDAVAENLNNVVATRAAVIDVIGRLDAAVIVRFDAVVIDAIVSIDAAVIVRLDAAAIDVIATFDAAVLCRVIVLENAAASIPELLGHNV